MGRKKRWKISYTLQTISTIPLLFLGVIILLLGSYFFTRAMHNEVELELKYVATNAITLLDTAYPGDYELRGDTYYRLYKGENDITYDYSLIDQMKENTGLDITLFYQDTRIQTTVLDSDGQRIIGTGASDIILNDVLYTGEAHFYTNAMVGYTTYFSYYVPLRNSDNSIVGMLFVGKPRNEVDAAVQECLFPLFIAVVLTIVLMSFCLFLYTKGLVNTLLKIRNYLSEVSSGNLDAVLSENALNRDDELGEISHSIQTMQHSLRKMVELDALTELYNRRSANWKLDTLLPDSTKKGTPLCIALGDIDFFKKINDTYGHEGGDLVLKAVSRTLKEHMRKYGFAARWGGEEFLLVFTHNSLSEAKQSLEELRLKISNLEIPYENQTIRFTMTLGVTENDGSGLDRILKQADDKLYRGKSSGRNRVVD